ncbi:hypothetical protein GQR58_010513 [Nymphon striatum]|nr:hypothetical protein GQR58_010513 [Nymphon striatum]
MKHESDLASQSIEESSRKLWVTITILLFILALLLFGYGPGGKNSEASSKMTVRLVDNPEHMKRISSLEQENNLIEGLREKIVKLEFKLSKEGKKKVEAPPLQQNFGPDDETEEMAGLRARSTLFDEIKPEVIEKVVEKEVDKLIDNPKHLKLIAKLEKENKELTKLRKKLKKLEKAKPKVVKKVVDNPKHLKEIAKLKKENKAISGLRKKIKELEKSKSKVVKKTVDNPKNIKLIEKLKKENQLIVSLKAQIKTLESAKPKVVKEVVKQWVGNEKGYGYGVDPKRFIELEKENRNLVSLLARIKVLEGIHPKVVEKHVGNPELLKRITVLETENNKMSDLLIRIKRLERSKPKVKQIKTLKKGETVVVKNVKKVTNIKKPTGKTTKNSKAKTKFLKVSKEKVVIEDSLLADLLRRVTKLEGTYSIKVDSNITLETENKIIIELREQLANQEKELKTLRLNMKVGMRDERILFASGSYIVTRRNSKKLTPIIDYLKENKKAKLVLSGFHDKSGLLIANQLLARQRAQVVKAIFVNAGINTDRITVSQPAEAVGQFYTSNSKVGLKNSNQFKCCKNYYYILNHGLSAM